MTEQHDPTLADLLNEITFLLDEPLDFTAADPETLPRKVRILTAAATYFNTLAVIRFGGRSGTARQEGLVEQVVAAAFQTFGGQDPHPQSFDKAAMLLRGITQGHPFNDGNKRTGFLTAAYYLQHVGHPFPGALPVDEAESLCLRVSAGDIREVDTIAETLRHLWQPR